MSELETAYCRMYEVATMRQLRRYGNMMLALGVAIGAGIVGLVWWSMR